MRIDSFDLLIRRTDDLVELRYSLIEFFTKHAIALDRIPADLLVGAVGHAVEIRDVSLQFGLAVADGWRDQVRREVIQFGELVAAAP